MLFIGTLSVLTNAFISSSRIGVPAVQERDEESIVTERDYQYRHRQGSFRQKLSETTHYGIPG